MQSFSPSSILPYWISEVEHTAAFTAIFSNICTVHAQKRLFINFRCKFRHRRSIRQPRFPISVQNFGDLATFSVDFYRVMLCIRGTSHGPVSVSVCLSVTSRSSTKTDKRRITQTTPHDSPGTLVFWCQTSPRNSTGVTPYEGAEWGGQNRRLSTNNRLYLENGTR